MEPIYSIIGYFAAAIASGLGGWLFGRKKYNEEVNTTKVQNFDAAIDAYKKMYEDMMGDLKAENANLKTEISELKQELSENRKQILTLTNFVLASAMQNGANAGNFEDLKAIIK